MIRRSVLLCGLAALLAAVLLPSASASAAGAPFWRLFGVSYPTHFVPGGAGTIELRIVNLGPAASNGTVTITDNLPAGLIATKAGEFHNTNGEITELDWDCSGVGTSTVTCTNNPMTLPSIGPGWGANAALNAAPFGEAPALGIEVEVGAAHTGTNTVTISGGGAPSSATLRQQLTVSSVDAPFALTSLDPYLTAFDGSPSTQAGSHPDQLTTSLTFANDVAEATTLAPAGDPKDIVTDLPPGLIGNPNATPTRCTREELDSNEEGSVGCPASSQIGEVALGLAGSPRRPLPLTAPLYNMVPSPGVPLQLGFRTTGISTMLDASLRTGGDYGATVTARNAAQRELIGARVTVWGVPADPSNNLRRFACEAVDGFQHNRELEQTYFSEHGAYDPAGPCGIEASARPFLTDPTSCSATQPWSVTTDSWLGQEAPPASTPELDNQGNPTGIDGCNRLDFTPTIEAKTTTDVADAPAGYDFDLHIPQNEDPEGLAEAELKNAVVTLPPGLVVNPASANGLEACSEAQLELQGPDAPTCPNASKIGNVEVDSPLIDHPLPGAVYLAKPEENPFGTLLAIYIVVDDPASGVIVKLPGEVRADPQSGRLTAVVQQSPQLPFEDFHLDFFEGAHAPLRSPSLCARYQTTATFTPWTSPEGADAQASDSFETTTAPGGGPCPVAESQLPNAPSFTAGTITPKAGAYSPAVGHVARADGSQQTKAIDATLPTGLLAKLAGVTYCSDAQIAAAHARKNIGEGALEIAHPSCPASSEVGTVTAGVGAGPDPYYVNGRLYLAGPYKGAPLSGVAIVPAVAGPYDLGVVVTRTPLYVNPETGQAHIVTDEIPQIIDGIPLDGRTIDFNIDRPNFTLNPTSCEKKAFSGSIISTLNQPAPLSAPFQVGECSVLGFAPKLKLSLTGGTKRNKNPALKAVVTYPQKGAYANIAKAAVTLPHSEFLDQSHIQTICTRVVFAEGVVPGERCPAGSIYGYAKATTPLLDNPVQGPVYLRASSNKLPDLVAALNGQINVVLDGRIDTGKSGGIRNTFDVVPDAPVTKFTLTMKGGNKSLLVNSENICKKPQHAVANFTAQNGKVSDTTPLISNSCAKKSKKSKKHGKH